MTAQQVLADFLRTDVQDYQPRIAEIRAALAQGATAAFIGNAFELALSPTQAVIRATHGPKSTVKMSAATFAAAFEAWVAALPSGL